MKSACVAWNIENNSSFEKNIKSIIEVFRLGGYLFDEMRFLSKADEKKLIASLDNLQLTYDNVVVVTDAQYLLYVKNALSSVLGEENFHGTVNGAGIFTQKEKSVLLLCANDSDVGIGYVKSTCLPYLERKYGAKLDRTVIRAVGANEQHVKNLLLKAKSIDGGNMR